MFPTLLTRLALCQHILILQLASSSASSLDTEKKYVLDLPNCKIPEVPLLGDAILPEWKIPFHSSCKLEEPITVVSTEKVNPDTFLSFVAPVYEVSWIFQKLTLANGSNNWECCWREILRPLNLVTDKYLLTECQTLDQNSVVDISSLEFILVNCSRKPGNVARKRETRSPSYEFHYNLPMTHEPLQEKLKFWNNRPTGSPRPFSLKFLLLDSVSHPHGLRSLPKTIRHLKETLGFIEFNGYHDLGEPTIHNYVPMMMGIATDHVGWGKKAPNYEGKWDSEPFIWHNFSQLNYVTMDSEDMAYWHTFHFNGRKGFTKRQMDFNTRPYFLIHEEIAKMTSFMIKYADKRIKYNALNCVDGKNVWDFLLDYTYEFLERFQNVPTFGITWWGWPNHDFLPATQVFDEPFVNFFKKLESNTTILDNTIVVLMGDHGFRWSNYSETKEGLLERNLPMFLIRLPPRFVEAYPEMAANLVQNANRLTTHVDLFQTLAHLHRLMTPIVLGKDVPQNSSYGYNAKYGTSLFTEISVNRTCEEARIPPRFCSCNYPLWDTNFKFADFKKAPVVEGLSSLAESQKHAKNAPKSK